MYQENSSWVIITLILITSLTCEALILQGEIGDDQYCGLEQFSVECRK